MKPIRIQRKRTKGWRMPPNTIYVGRGSQWGNPFFIRKPGSDHRNLSIYCVETPEEAVRKFKAWAQKDVHYLNQLNFRGQQPQLPFYQLRGKNLACWCSLDQPCHADVLLEIANEVAA